MTGNLKLFELKNRYLQEVIMTEREKMLSGELYDPTDKELEQLRLNARKLARKYNSTDEDDQEKKNKHRY